MSYTIEQTDAQLRKSTAAIRYHLSFPNAGSHLVHVRMEIDTDAASVEIALPNWIPGSYKIRDFISQISDLKAQTARGATLAYQWVARNRALITTGGARTVVVEYQCYANERSVRHCHVNRFHAFLNPAGLLFAVVGRTDEIHHVTLEHEWAQVSTALSPVRKGVLGAINYDVLVDSPLEIGDHFVATFKAHGAEHEVAITGTGDFDPAWLVDQVRTIVDTEARIFGGVPYDRYVFIIQLAPAGGGGLEHARSSVNLFDAYTFSDKERTVRLLSLLCHEYFHCWNVKRIRPSELGPFDYDEGNPSRMLWLAEGVTSYYDDLLVHRCGFTTRDEYLKILTTDRLQRLLDTPGRLVMSIKDSSYLAWVKLYAATPDSENRWPSYYLEGAVIFLLLDLWIIAETDGRRSMDDGMRALMRRYQANPAVGVTEDEFIEIVSSATGVSVGPRLRTWLNQAAELPIEDIASLVGLEWRRKPDSEPPTFGDGRAYIVHPVDRWLGLTLSEEKGGTLRVSKVVRDSPAEAAGLGADDEVIAVDGVRVSTTKEFDALVRGHGSGRIEILAAAERRLYKARVRPTTRPRYELRVRDNLTEQEAVRLEKWLGRRTDG